MIWAVLIFLMLWNGALSVAWWLERRERRRLQHRLSGRINVLRSHHARFRETVERYVDQLCLLLGGTLSVPARKEAALRGRFREGGDAQADKAGRSGAVVPFRPDGDGNRRGQ